MESIEQKLTSLKLGRMRQVYGDWIERAGQTGMDYGEFLEQLLTEELLGRQENQLHKRIRAASFPFEATLEQFEWNRHPELKRSILLRYFDSAFVEKAQTLLLIGSSGLGKTHLAVSVGIKMVQLGYSVRFITAQKLVNAVLSATDRNGVEKVLMPLLKCQLLILDELGYLPLDERIGPILFELVSGRYQKGATVITSNKSLSAWGELVGGHDTALMVAIIDRLLHHGEVFYLRGSSYRTQGKEGLKSEPKKLEAGGNGGKTTKALEATPTPTSEPALEKVSSME
jgi:DNA replication protein DnaC